MNVLGFMSLHYAGAYFKESLQSIALYVDKMHISYSKGPSHGMSTLVPNPDTEYQLRKIAQDVLGDKLIWESYAGFHTEQEHRDTRYKHSPGYAYILTIDPDEIFEGLPVALQYAEDHQERFYGIAGYKHFWKSFDWYFTDSDRPIRLEKLGANNLDTNHKCPLTVYHTSMIQLESVLEYKFSCFGHKHEVKKDYLDKWRQWTPEKIDDITHLHPTRDDIWIQPLHYIGILPDALKNHTTPLKSAKMRILWVPMDYQRHKEGSELFQDFSDALNIENNALFFDDLIPSFKPDVVLFQGQSGFSVELAKTVKNKFGNPLMLMYTGDCGYVPAEGLVQYKDVVDAYLLPFSGDTLELYQRMLGKPCHFLWEPIQKWRFVPNQQLSDGLITFVGNRYNHLPGGKPRAELLNLTNPRINLFGNGYEKGPINYTEVPRIYNTSYAVICENNHSDVQDYFTPRNLGAMAAGSCALMRWFPGIEKFFPNLSSCLWYRDKYELAQWIDYLVAHPEFRDGIADGGYKRANETFTAKHWADELTTIIKNYIR